MHVFLCVCLCVCNVHVHTRAARLGMIVGNIHDVWESNIRKMSDNITFTYFQDISKLQHSHISTVYICTM